MTVIVSDNTVEDELIPALPLSTHSAVEMLHDSALYKFMIDIDIDKVLRLEGQERYMWRYVAG